MTDLNLAFLLLLPVAAASGWFAAWRSKRHTQTFPISRFNNDYFKGLNYLLNEQEDKAIEVFLRMTEVDKDTVETHFALGNLFRKRGEVDRAIRIHQNLIARECLSEEYRSQALLALAEDYMRAGLLDRAEDLFKEIVQRPGNHVRALSYLIDIYEQEKDWVSAIEAIRELARQSADNYDSVTAQYFCELAEQARERGDNGAAIRYLEKALSTDPGCVRANLLSGYIHQQAGDYEKAIIDYKKVQGQDIEYVTEIIDDLLSCYVKLERPYDVMPHLDELVSKSRALSPMLAQASLIQARDGNRAAERYITEQLRRRPTVRGLDRLIDVHLTHCEESAKENLMMLRELTRKILHNRPVYSCVRCGFKGRSLHWQCPGCKSWHTMKPVHDVEG